MYLKGVVNLYNYKIKFSQVMFIIVVDSLCRTPLVDMQQHSDHDKHFPVIQFITDSIETPSDDELNSYRTGLSAVHR